MVGRGPSGHFSQTFFTVEFSIKLKVQYAAVENDLSKILDPKIGSSRRHLLVGKRTILAYWLGNIYFKE